MLIGKVWKELVERIFKWSERKTLPDHSFGM